MLTIIVSASCSEENEQVLHDGEAEVEMKLSVSDLGIVTRGLGDMTVNEMKIAELDILVFDEENNFLYKCYASKNSDDSFKSILKSGTGLVLYFAANSRTFLDSLESAMEGKTMETIKDLLVMGESQNSLKPNVLPMWGFKKNVIIKDKVINQLGTISMIRSVASVDFFYTGSTVDFTLSDGYICYVPTIGYLPFSEVNLDTNGVIITPESPAGMTTTNTFIYLVDADFPTTIANVFYLYENAADTLSSNEEYCQSKLIIKGTWNAGKLKQPTYYPLAFRDKKTNERFKITRNNKYSIVVTKVNGDGYSSLEEAKAAKDVNMEYDVITSDSHKDNEIFDI